MFVVINNQSCTNIYSTFGPFGAFEALPFAFIADFRSAAAWYVHTRAILAHTSTHIYIYIYIYIYTHTGATAPAADYNNNNSDNNRW